MTSRRARLLLPGMCGAGVWLRIASSRTRQGPPRNRCVSPALRSRGHRTDKQARRDEQEKRPGEDSYEIHEQHGPRAITGGRLDQTLLYLRARVRRREAGRSADARGRRSQLEVR